MLNQTIKESLGSIHIPSVVEPPWLCRTDAKRPDGLTLTPWIRGSPLLWDATVVDGLAPSRISDPHLIAGKAASEAEILKTRKYEPLIHDGYAFQPVAFETQGACGSETEIFLRDLGRRLAETSFEPRASSFLKQRALQIGNAASVVGTLKESDCLEDIFYLWTCYF